ncbi:hypothetical protein DF156_22295 [Burkholderia ubonensis]|uniref:Lipoprotein n=1 Tax=Burkholderia ubonensis TaxID=101571 RepID=A0AB74D7P4_9BURK|nr:hypothetical protein CJO71_09565 [Burkholderia ubonensis]PAJ83087.1 hypothetical protein CJO70_35350 [Burkholderia ubonensis]PAJ94658.1 hypothetical protein CJO69_10670 [Burkholderia ubonensis]PAK01547.1 hypothetical protein CJO68_08185 [Burkholderia ubonensis]PAK07219.1 hypothetical protein CJO67_14360 [Burkholderia ubonensis]
MFLRAISRWLGGGMLASALWLTLSGCDVLREPPVPDWPGPHAPYPFPHNVPHRAERATRPAQPSACGMHATTATAPRSPPHA